MNYQRVHAYCLNESRLGIKKNVICFSGRRSSKQQKTCIVITLRSSTIVYNVT